jgi:cell wall-associated NlpC family hydrolase
MKSDAHIAAAALKLVGTPWHHQGRVPGQGCDCVGVGVIAGRSLGLDIVDDLTYTTNPDPDVLLSYMEANCERADVAKIEDVPIGFGMLFWYTNDQRPQHFAIKTARGMVHARNRRSGKGGVYEQRIDSYYTSRLHSVWRYKWQA